MVYDLHCGKLSDLQFAIQALTKAPLEKEKIVIVISSVLSWGNTPAKMVEDKPEPVDDEEGDFKEKIDNMEDKEIIHYNIEDIYKYIDMEDMGVEVTNNNENYVQNSSNFPKNDDLDNADNNIEPVDDNGNPIIVKDKEGNILDQDDEEYIPRLKRIKRKIREIMGEKTQKAEIKVCIII